MAARGQNSDVSVLFEADYHHSNIFFGEVQVIPNSSEGSSRRAPAKGASRG